MNKMKRSVTYEFSEVAKTINQPIFILRYIRGSKAP